MEDKAKVSNNILDAIFLISVPLILVVCAILDLDNAAFLTLITSLAALFLFFLGFEKSKPSLRQIVPAATLGAIAAAGRILFAPIPDFKPVSAIAIISGIIFGKRTGFMVGCLAALVSNFFFGQGPWTPWQMYSWGLIGYLAGVFNNANIFSHKATLYVFGFLSGILYGLILNSWYIIGFVHPITIETIALAFGAAIVLDLIHCVATVIFLIVLYEPWKRKLIRIKNKFSL